VLLVNRAHPAVAAVREEEGTADDGYEYGDEYAYDGDFSEEEKG
jgi:hypothetical protein